ncbi:MAG: DUF234 domain-containing protein [Lachnospiraceae bacterium]
MISGRKLELQTLENYYARRESGIIVLYGQKDTGKLSLLKQFCRNKDVFYYLARPCSEKEQLLQFSTELKEELPVNTPISESYAGLLAALLSLGTEKKIIIIDEFQQMIKYSPSFMKELLRTAYEKSSVRSVLFFLCSSSVYWVENAMVGCLKETAYEITGLLKIGELKFSELTKNYKKYSVKSRLETYAVLGGLPGLWQYWDGAKTVAENICDGPLNKGSYLHEAGLHLLPEEVREPVVYNTILLALASGKRKLNELHAHTGFDRAKISVYLKNLIELSIVEKVTSVETAGRGHSQKGIYRISNHFVHFWFRYVFARLSRLQMMSAEKFYRKYIEPSFRVYTAEYFVEVCMEYLRMMNREDRLEFKFTQIGSWVGKFGRIDIAARDENGRVLLGCCVWEQGLLALQDYEQLLSLAKQAGLNADACYLFSSDGFDKLLSAKAKTEKTIHLIDSTRL